MVSLVSDLETAKKAISDRIALGLSLQNRGFHGPRGYEDIRLEFQSWDDYNRDLLLQLFSANDISIEYMDVHEGGANSLWDDNHWIEHKREHFRRKISKLESITSRLHFFTPKATTATATNSLSAIQSGSGRVFLVHGHDSELKITTARLVEQLGLEPIILHELPNSGRTLIEKLESASSDVDFAIVLLTSDDLGRSKSVAAEKELPRARQNVVLELGYFFGKLTRKKVVAVLEEGVEKPSDIEGLVYIPYDKHGAWRYKVCQEMNNAGLNVDSNRIK